MKIIPTFTRSLLTSMAGGLLVLVGWTAPSSATAGDDMMQAFEQYKNAWNSHDLEALAAYYGKGATYTDPGAGKVSGPAIIQTIGGLFTAFPDFKVKVVSADPVDADTLAEQWVVTGTWKKPFPGGPLAGAKPSGKSFTVPGASFLEWNDGKIESSIQYYDQMSLLTQIGVIPPPGENPQASAR